MNIFFSQKIKILGDGKAEIKASNNQTVKSVKTKISKSSIILTEEEEMFVKQQLSSFRKQQPKHDITDDITITNKLPTQPNMTLYTTRNTLTQPNMTLDTTTNTLPTHYLTLDSTTTNTLQMQQNTTLASTTNTLQTQLSTASDDLQTHYYLTDQNKTLDTTTNTLTQPSTTLDTTTNTLTQPNTILDTTINTLPTNYLTIDSTTTNASQMQQNMTLASTTNALQTQLSTASDDLQTHYYLTDQNKTLDTTTTNNLQTFHDLTETLPTFQEILEETTDTVTKTLPHDWTNVVWTDKDMTLQAIYGKLEEVNKKVEQIICYLGIPNSHRSIEGLRGKRETHTTTCTTDLTVNEDSECDTGEKYEVPSQIKQKALAVSSSRGNFAKNLVSLLYTTEERLGRNCTGRSTASAVEPLNQAKLCAIKECVLEVYGVPPNMHQKVWREECVKCIDAFCRKERYRLAKHAKAL